MRQKKKKKNLHFQVIFLVTADSINDLFQSED